MIIGCQGVQEGGEDFGCLILPRSGGIPHVRENLNWWPYYAPNPLRGGAWPPKTYPRPFWLVIP